MDPSNEDYYRSEIGSGAHGEEYQREVALLMLERATRAKCDFKLAYEMSDAGKFDDIALFDKNKKEWILIQAKHTDTVKGPPKPIDWAMLFPKNEKDRNRLDFSLFKYLKSYLEVQNQFSGSKKFYIFTNRTLSAAIKDNFQDCEAYQLLQITNGAAKHVQLKSTDDIVDKLHGYINPVLRGESTTKELPPFVERTQVEDFLRNLVLSVGQPANLRSIIEREMRIWMKTWILSDDFGRLTATQASGLFTKFNDLFCDFCRTTCKDQKLVKQYFTVVDGERFLGIIQKELIQQLRNPSSQIWEEFERHYINRQIVYTEQNDRKREEPCSKDIKIEKQPLLKEAQVKITDRDFANQMMDKFSKQKCLIFIAEPGMGKTTLLQYISFQVQQEDNCHVFLIYLNHVQKNLKEVKNVSDLDQALNVFRDVISESNRNIIKNAAINDGEMNSDRIVIFCDGFDEVHPNQAERMIQVLKQMMSVKCVQIVISGRRHVEDLLENSFTVKSMRIAPLMDQDQIELFLKFGNANADEATKCNSLVSYFLSHYKDINRAQCNSTSSPLIIRMLSEVHSDQFERTLKPGCDEAVDSLFPPKILDKVDLYHIFVKKCFKVKMIKKLNIIIDDDNSDDEYDSLRDTFILEHQSLAVKQLEIEETYEYLKTLTKTYAAFKARVDKGSEKSILVEKVAGKIQFTHLSFAEYFAAKLLFDHVADFTSKLHAIFEPNPGVRKFFFTMMEKWQVTEESEHFRILNTHQNGEIETQTGYLMAFYACEANCINLIKLWSKHHDLISLKHNKMRSMLHVAVENDCTEIFRLLISKCGSDYLNENGGSLLFKASDHGNGDIVKLLIDKGVAVNQLNHHNVKFIQNDINNITDKEDKWAPLHIASYNGHEHVCQLLIESAPFLIDIQQSDGLTPLYFAAQNGHADIAKLLVEKGAAINMQGQSKSTLLQIATSIGHVDIVELLITHGASVDMQDQNQWTPIHFAAQNGHIDIVQLLIDHDAKVDGKAEYGITPLHMAAQNGHAGAAKLLIGKKASVDAQKENKWTPLHIAAQNGHDSIVKLLVESSAKVDVKNVDGNIPLHVAAINGHTNVASLLLECAPLTINIKNDDGQTPLHMAANSKVAELLIKNGASLDIKDDNEWTPLYFAVQENRAELTQLLVDHNASVDIQTKNGTTPLHIAALHGNFDSAKVLVKHHPPVVNIQNKVGATPLNMAVLKGYALVAELLIDHGAIIDPQGSNDWPSLFYAAMYGYSELVELLINNNANINVKNKDGLSPLYIAAQNGFTRITELLVSKGAKVDVQKPNGWTPLQIASKNNKIDVVKLLIESEAKVNKTNKDGLSALHVAAAAGHIDVVELLTNSNASIDIKDKEGCTPLYYAVQEGHADIVNLLVKLGAKVNIRRNDGVTLLYTAVQNGHLDVANHLIQQGVSVNIPNNNNAWTPLHVAAQNGQDDLVNLLIESDARIEVKNDSGLTPLQIAAHKGYANIVLKLINKGALVNFQEPSGWTSLHMAAQNGHVDVVQHLIDSGARVDIMENKRNTPLYVAAENGKIKIVELLITSCAAVNVKDKDGTAPLYIAAQNGHVDVAKYLIKHGALVDIQDKKGWTPLHIAVQNGHIDVVKLLLASDATLSIEDNNSSTAFLIATRNGHIDIAKLLNDAVLSEDMQ